MSRCTPTLCACLLLAHVGHAHEGDPKAQDRWPRVEAERFGRGGSLALSSDSFSFPASGVNLMSWVTLRDLGTLIESGNSCFGYVSTSGREYAAIGHSIGTTFVEVTDPGDPQIVGTIAGPESIWRDIKIYQNHAYVVTESGVGIQVVDLSQIDSGFVTLVNVVTAGGGDLSTHTLALDAQSGFLYRSGGENYGLRMYSLASPASPAFVGSWSDRYVHEAQVVTYTSGTYANRQIAFCCSGFNGGFAQTGVDILDVTNKSNVFLVKRYFYPNAGYSHQGWLSPDRKFFYLNDEKDEQYNLAPPSTTRVINVQNLSNPFLAGTFASGAGSIDHNLYTQGNLIFESNYSSGLRVFDATNPVAPTQIAWFDTWPDDDLSTFRGLWNNYPYLPSGTVLGSDIQRGLFVWTIGAPKLAFAFPGGTPDFVAPNGALIGLQITEASPGTLVSGSPTLYYDAGSGWTSAALVSQGGGAFQAPFPTLACGSDVAWYLSARTSGTPSTTTWYWPQGAPTIVAHATAALAQTVVLTDNLETPSGWTGGLATDTATRGKWELADPEGTLAQSSDDHTQGAGKKCWVTGDQGEPLVISYDDIDGGQTTLLSPVYDLSALSNPVIRYWRWYSTHLGPAVNQDVFVIDVTSNQGQSWTNVETIGPGGPGTSGGWILHQFVLADFVQPSANVQVRFIASDFGAESIVEAAIDDMAIFDVGCPPSGPTTYCSAKVNSQGCLPAIGSSGLPSASSPVPFPVSATNVINQKTGLLIYGFAPASTPFQGGTLCVAPPFQRTAPQDSAGNVGPDDCSGAYAYDFNTRIQSGIDPALVPGTSVDAQYWYRDPADPAGFATGSTNAIEFTIAP